jgi:uncharacterized lipoprotein YajG
MHSPTLKLLKLLTCLCAGAILLAGCAATPGNANPRPTIRCDETGSTAERHACR